MKCDKCTEKCPQEELACEIAKGRMYATKEVIELQKELQSYKDAEEQGLLLRLPCKVGDWLYYPCLYYNVVVPVRLNDVSISFIGLENYSYQYNCCSFDGCGDVYEDYEFDNDDIGKTVFLTEEEAEQALEQMKAGADNE